MWGFSYYFSIEVANILLTVASILFSVVFSILSIVTAKSKSNDEIEKKVIHETFISICTTTFFLLLSIILLIIYVIALGSDEQVILYKIMSNFILFILIHTIMLITMIIKRFVLIFLNDSSK